MAIAVVLRFVQGMGDACITTSCNHVYKLTDKGYSIVSLKFPERREVYLGYCAIALGLGLMLGPVLGQTIYTQLEFQWTFFCFALIQAFFFAVALVVIPGNFDNVKGMTDSIVKAPHLVGNPARKERRGVLNTLSTIERKISYKEMLSDRRVLVATVSAAAAMLLMFFFDSILSDHLLEIGVSDSDIGKIDGVTL